MLLEYSAASQLMHRLSTMSHVEGGLDAVSPSNCIEKVRFTPHAAANVDHLDQYYFFVLGRFPFLHLE